MSRKRQIEMPCENYSRVAEKYSLDTSFEELGVKSVIIFLVNEMCLDAPKAINDIMSSTIGQTELMTLLIISNSNSHYTKEEIF